MTEPIEEKQYKTERSVDPFTQTKDRVLQDFHKAGAMSSDVPSEKKRIGMKGITPASIRIDENVRKWMDTEGPEFQKLVESVKTHGILQSVLVEERTLENGEIGYVCVEGHRRVLAARAVDLQVVPCIVKKYSSSSARTEEALAADMKEFLNPLDRAEAYFALTAQGKTVEEIAYLHDRDPLTITRYLKMARWAPDVKQLIREHHALFSAKFLLHNYVQKSVEGEVLKDAVVERINAAGKQAVKPKKKLKPDQETAINSQILALQMQKLGIETSVRQNSGEIVATLHLSQDSLKAFVDALKKAESIQNHE